MRLMLTLFCTHSKTNVMVVARKPAQQGPPGRWGLLLCRTVMQASSQLRHSDESIDCAAERQGLGCRWLRGSFATGHN